MAEDSSKEDGLGDGSESTDWDDAMKQLNLRQQGVELDGAEGQSSETEPKGPAEGGAFRFSPVESGSSSSGSSGSSGFRFENKANKGGPPETVAGLDRRDEALLRNAYLIGGRALTFITLASIVFYIYVGVTGGITDGFDRFPDAVNIEPLSETIAREGAEAFTPSF